MAYKDKLNIVRERLSGKGYFTAMQALSFARKIHDGVRKDKVTPEFQHQLDIVLYLFTLEGSIDDLETTLILALLHDTPEDNPDVTFEDLSNRFGANRSDGIRVLTKEYRGQKLTTEFYYSQLGLHRAASLVKGADRPHNLGSMVGVFTLPKQVEYIDETEKYTIPMIQEARENFPSQRMAYENEKHLMQTQIRLIRAIHEASKTT